jgi:hypothetical protein
MTPYIDEAELFDQTNPTHYLRRRPRLTGTQRSDSGAERGPAGDPEGR